MKSPTDVIVVTPNVSVFLMDYADKVDSFDRITMRGVQKDGKKFKLTTEASLERDTVGLRFREYRLLGGLVLNPKLIQILQARTSLG